MDISTDYLRARLALYEKMVPRVRCKNCGKMFLARRSDARTCSINCRVALHRKRSQKTNGSLHLISVKEANAILDGKHYLGKIEVGALARFCIATQTRDAVAVFSRPVASHLNAKAGLRHPLELARLWQSGKATMPLSHFLAQCLRWLPTLAPKSDCVFSYADPSRKNRKTGKRHTGTIYQATNFVYLGTSSIVNHWLTPGGKKVSSPRCYRMFKTKSLEKIQRLRPKWKLVRGKPKHLYVFGLRRSPDEVLAIIRGRYKNRQSYPR